MFHFCDCSPKCLGSHRADRAAANLADSIGREWDAARTRDQFAMLLAVRQRVLTTGHPDTHWAAT
jgi:hypothetical protein